MELRHGPYSYGRQQPRIFRNAHICVTERRRVKERNPEGCKLLSDENNSREIIILKEAANFVPAAAVIRRPQALSGFIGRKGSAGGIEGHCLNP